MSKRFLTWRLCKKFLLFPFFLVFKQNFTRYVEFTRTAASSAAMTSQLGHTIFNADLLYYCAHFIVKIDEKFSINDGLIRFNYNA